MEYKFFVQQKGAYYTILTYFNIAINFTIASSIWQAVNVSPRYRKLLNVAIVKLTKILKLSQLKQAVSHVVPWDTACSFFVPS